MQAAFGFPASTNLSHGETFVSEQRKKICNPAKGWFCGTQTYVPRSSQTYPF